MLSQRWGRHVFSSSWRNVVIVILLVWISLFCESIECQYSHDETREGRQNNNDCDKGLKNNNNVVDESCLLDDQSTRLLQSKDYETDNKETTSGDNDGMIENGGKKGNNRLLTELSNNQQTTTAAATTTTTTTLELLSSHELQIMDSQHHQQQLQQRKESFHRSAGNLVSIVSSRHAFLADPAKRHRIAHACDSDYNSDYGCNYADYPSMAAPQSLATKDFSNPFSGMVLQVFQQQPSSSSSSSLQEDESETCSWTSNNPIQDTTKQHSTPHEEDNLPLPLYNQEFAMYPHSFHLQVAYQLVEPLYLELGIVPKHYWDYAYTPVHTTTTTHHNVNQPPPMNHHPGHVPCRTTPPSTTEQRHTTTNNIHTEPVSTNNYQHMEHNYDTCIALKNSDKGLMESEDDEEHRLDTHHHQFDEPGHSWWSWWFPFSSPWWQGQSAKPSDYTTTTKSAFAGGSHGQVWRGKRVCPKRVNSNNAPPNFFWQSSSETHRGNNYGNRNSENDGCSNGDKPLILKRLLVDQGYRMLEAGLREIYFGQWIQGLVKESEKELFTTYVDHFFRERPRAFGEGSGGRFSQTHTKLELWIIFEDAGPSLRNYLYTPISTAGGLVMFQHSPLWAKLRMANQAENFKNQQKTGSMEVSTTTHQGMTSKHHTQSKNHTQHNTTPPRDNFPNMGRQILRSILQQILSAAATLHRSGIVHRDIKPSNVMCTSDVPLNDLYTLKHIPQMKCRLGDFSSGWDKYTDLNLYTKGPSPAEQTDEYAPPESFIGPNWVPFDKRIPQSYDSWSIGVLALELLLGTPNVFSVDQRTTVLLTTKMKKEGASEEEIQHALYLAALSQFCIFVPNNAKQQKSWPLGYGDPLHKTAMVKESCTLHDFHRALRARDPLGLGFDSSADLLLHLIWQLLAWDPAERITPEEALQHPFFHNPDGTKQPLAVILGQNKALEPRISDPRLDSSAVDSIHEFICPKCFRVFADWQSCHRHANTRKHAKFCKYDRLNLPTCINTHSMLPAHPTSGYCDLQGRRRTIEDFHSIHLRPTVQFYGMFDGHTGNVASKYVASTLFDRLMEHLPTLQESVLQSSATTNWKEEVERNVSQAFQEIHESFLEVVSLAPSMDQSGTTATALLVTDDVIVVSSLGDSRAVLSSIQEGGSLVPIQLTHDHVASDMTEREQVIARGGFVSFSGGINRVNGTLAITRSIGDAALSHVLSRVPHVVSMKRDEVRALCGVQSGLPCFIVLASDGLWDVITNEEAIEMVAEVIAAYESVDHVSWNNGGAFQEAAEVLAIEAFVRGSTDNIGVCVVAVG